MFRTASSHPKLSVTIEIYQDYYIYCIVDTNNLAYGDG